MSGGLHISLPAISRLIHQSEDTLFVHSLPQKLLDPLTSIVFFCLKHYYCLDKNDDLPRTEYLSAKIACINERF